MTYEQLKRQILNLGFETSKTYEEEPAIMVDAINRALREITNVFPLVGVCKIAQYPLPNLLGIPPGTVHHYDGVNPLVYQASGAKSLYFECSGVGSLTISDQNGVRTIALSGSRAFMPYRAFLNGGVTLTFSGEYSYDVKNLAVYGEVLSGELSDIPAFGRHVRYDLRELTKVGGVPVFIRVLEVLSEGGDSIAAKNLNKYTREVIILDTADRAELTVIYQRNFIPITEGTPDDFALELPEDREYLLPLLAAWYVFAEDDPVKAAKCRNDYEDFKAQLIGAVTVMTDESFENSAGW